MDGSPSQVFTIGHSNRSLESFVALLGQHDIALVVDCRSYPKSKYAQQFDKVALTRALPARSILYTHMGRELGGRPTGDEYYDDDGHVLYSRVADSTAFEHGLARLQEAIEHQRVAVMCSEEDPSNCHRHLLIARVLTDRGVSVVHIRGDGSLQGETELIYDQTRGRANAGQIALFEEPAVRPQGAAWRSTRSVSPRKARPSSSEP